VRDLIVARPRKRRLIASKVEYGAALAGGCSVAIACSRRHWGLVSH
jgi:hypothetical protein